ncbi:unnamed protein product [Calypogeia fissa]
MKNLQTKAVRLDAANPKHIMSNSMTTLLLGAVIFLLLVDSVASTSRSLQNLSGYGVDSRAEVVSGLGSFTSQGRMTQRAILQDNGFQSPSNGGGGPGNDGQSAPPPPRPKT